MSVVAVRTLVDPRDPADVAAVAALQDRLAIHARSDGPLVPPAYDTGGSTAPATRCWP